jgi:DNA-binding MarR family transcriptional regulator
MDFDKMNSAGYLVNHMARLFAKGLQDRIAPIGIVIGQFPILLELWARDGITQKQLVAKLDIEQATIANTLNRMERDKMIHRTAHPNDARAQQIWLTGKAKAMRQPALNAALDQNTLALSGLNKDEKIQFMKYMTVVIATMQPTGDFG